MYSQGGGGLMFGHKLYIQYIYIYMYFRHFPHFKLRNSMNDPLDTTLFRKVYRNRAKRLLFVLLAQRSHRRCQMFRYTFLNMVISKLCAGSDGGGLGVIKIVFC